MNINDLDRLIALQEIGKPNSISTDLQNNFDGLEPMNQFEFIGLSSEPLQNGKNSHSIPIENHGYKSQMQLNHQFDQIVNNPAEIDISFTTTMDSTMYIKKIWFSWLLECFQNILLASIQFEPNPSTRHQKKQWFPNTRDYYVEKMKHVVEMKPIFAKRYQFQKAEFLQYAKTTNQPFLVGMSESIVQLFEQRFESMEKILQMEQKAEHVMMKKDLDACETLTRSLSISMVEYHSHVENIINASSLLEKEIVQSFSLRLDNAARQCDQVSRVAKEMMGKYGTYLQPFLDGEKNENDITLQSIQLVAKKIQDALLFLGQAQKQQSCSIQYIHGLESAIQEMQKYILEYGLETEIDYEDTQNTYRDNKIAAKSLVGGKFDLDQDELENVSNQRKKAIQKDTNEKMVFSTSVLEKIAKAAGPEPKDSKDQGEQKEHINEKKANISIPIKSSPTPSIKACTQKIETIESQIQETRNLLEMAQREYSSIHEKMKRVAHSNFNNMDNSHAIQDLLKAAQQSKDQITKIDQVMTTLTCSLEMARMEYEKVKMVHHAQAHGTWIQQLKELVTIGKQVQFEYEKVVTELEKEKYSLRETQTQRIEKMKQQTIQTMRLATRTMLDQRIMEWKQINAQLFGPLMTKLQQEQQEYSRQMSRLQTSIYMDHPMMGTKLADLGNAADALLQDNEECILLERIMFVMEGIK